jgi:hypothetical protein
MYLIYDGTVIEPCGLCGAPVRLINADDPGHQNCDHGSGLAEIIGMAHAIDADGRWSHLPILQLHDADDCRSRRQRSFELLIQEMKSHGDDGNE